MSENEAIPPSHVRDEVLKFCKTQIRDENPRLYASAGSLPGDGYMSRICRIRVVGEEKELHIIAKLIPENEIRRKMSCSDSMFVNEEHMYRVVLPKFAEFLAENQVIAEKQYPNIPRCYAIRLNGKGEDFFLMEDLAVRGFIMGDRKVGVNKEQCLLVLSALARLHSTSRAFEIQKPDEFQKLRSKLKEVFITKDSVLFTDTAKTAGFTALDVTKSRFPEGSVGRAKLKHLCDNFEDELLNVVKPSEDGFNVINHSDCTAINVMFKTNPKTGHTEELCLIDWQISRYCSPAVDLAHFLFLSTVRKVRGDLSDLLKYYVDQFNENIRALGSPNHTITIELLNNHMKRCAKMGIGLSIPFLPFMLVDSKDMPDLDSYFKEGRVLKEEIKNWKCPVTKEVEERCCDILEDAVNLGYL